MPFHDGCDACSIYKPLYIRHLNRLKCINSVSRFIDISTFWTSNFSFRTSENVKICPSHVYGLALDLQAVTVTHWPLCMCTTGTIRVTTSNLKLTKKSKEHSEAHRQQSQSILGIFGIFRKNHNYFL